MDPVQLQSLLNTVASAGQALLSALQAAPVTTPPVTTTPTPPAPSTIIVGPSTATLTDGNGVTFAFGAPSTDIGATIWGYKIVVNGVPSNDTAALMTVINGVFFSMNVLGQWSAYVSGKFVSEIPVPVPTITSPDGTTLTDVGSFIFDSSGRTFMFWGHPDFTYGTAIAVNGTELGNIGTSKLTITGGIVASTTPQGKVQHWAGTAWGA